MDKNAIKKTIADALRSKFRNHKAEPATMPFHTRLLGRDSLALYSFIHSLNTNFGTTIFEPVALALSKEGFARSERQYVSPNRISSKAQEVIQQIIDDLSTARTMPCKAVEVERIREVCLAGQMHVIKPTRVDLMMQRETGEIYYFDLKTAKPNSGEFQHFKRTLLEWVAVTLAVDPTAMVHTGIAIPYNPYEPQPYARWTMRGMIDLDAELLVGEELWDFIGGQGSYNALLDCFEEVGIEMRGEIDAYFAQF